MNSDLSTAFAPLTPVQARTDMPEIKADRSSGGYRLRIGIKSTDLLPEMNAPDNPKLSRTRTRLRREPLWTIEDLPVEPRHLPARALTIQAKADNLVLHEPPNPRPGRGLSSG